MVPAIRSMEMETGHAYSERDISKEIPIPSANRKSSKEYKNPQQTLGLIWSLVNH
jgi:hypothetical protein